MYLQMYLIDLTELHNSRLYVLYRFCTAMANMEPPSDYQCLLLHRLTDAFDMIDHHCLRFYDGKLDNRRYW